MVHHRADVRETGNDFLEMTSAQTTLQTFPVTDAMNITGFIWIEEFENKILRKHGVTTEEAEQVFFNQPTFRFMEREEQAW